MMKQGTMDLTTGRPMKQILLFSLPLILGSLFQQLYGFIDTIMVGRLISNDALAAVGSIHSLQFLTLGFVQGACGGFGVPLARSVGAREPEEFKKYFFNGCWLCVVVGAVFTIGTVLGTDLLLQLLKTPADIFADAKNYVQVIFLGIPASILYNFCAGALRAVGDSKRPFYFLLFSSALNIVLDYLFIVPIPMGVAGAALATVLSQLVSGLLNLFWLVRKTDCLKDCAGLRRPSREHLIRLCKVGFPMGFEASVSALGAVVLQTAINGLGTVVVTGQTTGEKIRQIFTLPLVSFGTGMATYVSQNDGAGRTDRIKAGIKAGMALQVIYSAASWVVIFFTKEFLTELVLGADPGPAGELSVQYLTIISTLFCIQGGLMIMRNVLQGLGRSAHAVFSGVGELAGRAVGGWLAGEYFGFLGICFANPLAWLFALIYCSAMVFHFLKKRDMETEA